MRAPRSFMSLAATAAGLVSVVVAQLQGWEDSEVNTTMCMWQQLRAAVVRDTLYLDGGYLYWTPGLSDGSYGSILLDQNTVGYIYALNFSKPFKMSQNISALFEPPLHKVGDGNNAPVFFDGAMLANDDEFFLYGGLLVDTDVNVDPGENDIGEWQAYDYGVEKPLFTPSYKTVKPSNLTRYLAYGGAANAPSENLAFYFSGMRAPEWGEVNYPSGDESETASVVSDTLITLDMAVQDSEKWSNATIPSAIPGRANPELVWVPVGEKGILVALGGVVYPEFITGFHASDNQSASEDQSPAFMTSINIYDIAKNTWYTQDTTGGPGALARGCAVMQPAKDYSSFNIYWYGGYDGLHATDQSYFKDDVWVLSLPSFTWTKVKTGRTGQGRAGHKCVMPYPDQMMVVGGYPAQVGTGGTCLTEIVQLFNVSSAEWLDSYDPAKYSDYAIPSAVYSAIGGDAQGSATITAPSSWDTSALEKVFQTAYSTSKITHWYPYPVAATASSIPTYTSPAASGSKGSVPKYLAPLLGVILGLVLVTSVVVGFLLWRRRKLMRKNGGVSVVSTDENGNRIVSWLNGQRIEKGTTATESTEPPQQMSPEPEMAALSHPHQYQHQSQHQYPFPEHQDQLHQVPYEMEDTKFVAELPDNSRLPELSESSMSPSEIVERKSRFGTASPMGHRSMFSPFGVDHDHASMVSSNSAAGASHSARGGIPPAPPSSASHQSSSVAGGAAAAAQQQQQPHNVRPDSSALPQTSPSSYRYGARGGTAAAAAAATQSQQPQDPSPRGESGVSAFSERERTHLRNLSDPATVSTMDGTITAASSPPLHQHGRFSPTPRPIMEEGTLASLNGVGGGGGGGVNDGDNGDHSTPRQMTTEVTVSPPTAGDVDGEDYVSARGGGSSGEEVVSPVVPGPPAPRLTTTTAANEEELPRPGSRGRRSAFRESTEDI